MTTRNRIPTLAVSDSGPFAIHGEGLAIGAPAYGSEGVWSIPATDRTRLAAQLT
jgi:hypothetical protein